MARVVRVHVAGAGLVSVGVSARHVAAVDVVTTRHVGGHVTSGGLRAGHEMTVTSAAGQVVFVRQYPDRKWDPALAAPGPGEILAALPAV